MVISSLGFGKAQRSRVSIPHLTKFCTLTGLSAIAKYSYCLTKVQRLNVVIVANRPAGKNDRSASAEKVGSHGKSFAG